MEETRVQEKDSLKAFGIYFFISALFLYKAFTQPVLIATADAGLVHYPWRLYFSQAFIHQGLHLWVPYIFLGMPFLGMMQTGALYPLNWIYFFLPAAGAYNFSMILHYTLAAFFTFQYVRLLGLGKFPSFLAGLTFAFPGFLMAHKQHVSMVDAAIWLPLLLFFYEKIRRNLRLEDTLWASLIVAVQVFAGHFQMSLYSYIVLGVFLAAFLPEINREMRGRFVGLCILPLVLGLLIALPQEIATRELVTQNFHAKFGLYTVLFQSFHPYQLATLIFPFIFGGGYHVPYFAQGFLVEYLGFTGIFALLLAVVVIVKDFRNNPHVRFLTYVAATAFILMLGGSTALAPVFFRIPMLQSFRALSRNIFEFDFAVSVLFAYGYSKYLSPNGNQKKLIALLLSLMVFLEFLLMWIKPFRLPLHPLEELAKTFVLTSPTFWIPVAFTLLYLIWLSLFWNHRPLLSWVLLASLVLGEAFFCQSAFDAEWVPRSATESLMQNPMFQYLSRNIHQDRFAYTGYFTDLGYVGLPLVNSVLGIRLLNGYDPLVPNNVQNLLDMNYFGSFSHAKGLVRNNLILSLLATRYLIAPPSFAAQEIRSYTGLPHFKKAEIETLPLQAWGAKTPDFVLQSGDGKTISVLKQQIPYYPHAAYEIMLDAKAERPLSAQLFFDLYADNFYSDDNRLSIASDEISKSLQRYSTVVFVPKNLHGPLYARIYTFSQEPIQIKNIQIRVIRNYHPYFMIPPPAGQASEKPFYQKVFQIENLIIWENHNALPRLFPVQEIQTIHSINEMKEQLYMLQANPAETAFMFPEDQTGLDRIHFSRGDVEDFSENTDDIHAHVNFSGTGFLVLSDEYFPGWQALVDGQKTKIYLVDGALRGIVVPPGKHSVEFFYRPTQIYCAAAIGVITLLSVLGALLWRQRQKRSE